MKHVLLFICIVLGCSFTKKATTSEPVIWDISTEKIDGSTFLVMKANIEDGWKLFGAFPTSNSSSEGCDIEGDFAPICMEVQIEEGKSLVLGNVVSTEEAKKSYDEMFQASVKYYTGKIELRQKIKCAPNKKIKGYIQFMTCNHEICSPPDYADFDLKIVE